MSLSELFWNASIEEVKKGYVKQKAGQEFTCLICGKTFEKGIIYKEEEVFYEVEKYLEIHTNKEHGSVFSYLLNIDKKYTGLTSLQKDLLVDFYEGLSDQDIVKKLGSGSPSTIRNHRFTLREREKQAKIFLSIMELLKDRMDQPTKFVEIHRTATMVDERYAITEDENTKFLEKYFEEGLDGEISRFPKKEKQKIIILRHIIKRFELNKHYNEKEVNVILKGVFSDFVTLRRYLIEYGFMDRTNDGSDYWIKI